MLVNALHSSVSSGMAGGYRGTFDPEYLVSPAILPHHQHGTSEGDEPE